MDKREQIRRYFQTFPHWAVWLIILGVPLMAMFGLGVLMIAAGVLGLAKYMRRPADAQIDAWVEEDLRQLRGRALIKSGIDDSELVGDAVVVTGLRFWNLPPKTTMAYRVGKDGIVRFTPLEVTVIHFTPNQLLVYQCALDLTTGHPLNENTDEYFYRDVVSVSTVTRSVSVALPGGQSVQAKAAETFRLTTSGGTSVEVMLSDPDVLQAMGGGTIPKTRVEMAIQSVRKMLREKKRLEMV